mmetsp:Transcript_18593/g.32067  ORF Transcript_18593/g.32067 Transcript_18593/m.32067 type:complete len:208 (-) Transcript_18593:88-711(-)
MQAELGGQLVLEADGRLQLLDQDLHVDAVLAVVQDVDQVPPSGGAELVAESPGGGPRGREHLRPLLVVHFELLLEPLVPQLRLVQRPVLRWTGELSVVRRQLLLAKLGDDLLPDLRAQSVDHLAGVLEENERLGIQRLDAKIVELAHDLFVQEGLHPVHAVPQVVQTRHPLEVLEVLAEPVHPLQTASSLTILALRSHAVEFFNGGG